MKRAKPKTKFVIADYNPSKHDKECLKKWCIEQALRIDIIDQNGNHVQPDLIRNANKIYDWVTK